ncbi:MAG: carboxypeptidase-like regulatory domain-containing protein [Candidatus Sericytochromatia bacterium]|nr:carboxypeptidase-like regulatory domain-containing protein [Candidatus Sericytochromatia bacterium]
MLPSGHLRAVACAVGLACGLSACAGRLEGSFRSAGLPTDVTGAGVGAPPPPAPAAPPAAAGGLLTPPGEGAWLDERPRPVPADPLPVPVAAPDAPPAPGLPTVVRAEPQADQGSAWVEAGGDGAGRPPGQPAFDSELPVYTVEVPAEPPVEAFRLPSAVANRLPGGGASVSGLVRNLHPAVKAPVPEAWVVVLSAADPARAAKLRTDAQGRFRLSGVEPGGYFIRVEKAGVGVTRPQYVLLGAGATAGVDFALYDAP